MSMNWLQYVQALAGFLPENLSANPAGSEAPFIAGSRYNLVIDRCIEYAELRMYRDPELDFLGAYTLDGSQTSVSRVGIRDVANPGLVVIKSVNVITPAGSIPNSAGSSRTPLMQTSVPFLNMAWPAVATQGTPVHWARNDDANILVGPYPDARYQIEFYGTMRPAPLTYQNTTTFLTLNLPDLFVAASMIFMSGYQKTFGAISGDPQQGMTWEQYYGSLRSGAAVEEARKKGRPPAPPPAAPPPAG
jgi:hypothetical protein